MSKLMGSNPDADLELLSESNRMLGRASLLTGRSAAARQAYQRAEELHRERIRHHPLNPQARLNLARTELEIGDLELVGLGNVQAGLERYRSAESDFAALIEKDKDNPELHWYQANARYALGRTLQSLGRRDEAQAYFRQCLVNPEGAGSR